MGASWACACDSDLVGSPKLRRGSGGSLEVRWALRYVRHRVSVEFRILGPLEARSVGRRLELGGPRHPSGLAVLLRHAGAAVPAGALIDEVWGDEPPETAINLLQGYV